MPRLVREIMTARVVTVGPDDPVTAAVDRMTRFGFSALPVVSGSFRLVGVVSLLDVLRFREDHPDDAGARVGEIMTDEVVSMQATANVAAVAQRMRSHGELRMVPVVQRGQLVGVVTRGDLLRQDDRTPRPSRLRRLLAGRAGAERAEDDALFALARDRRTGPPPPAGTPVTAIMTREVDTVGPADPLAVAAGLMLARRHSALPVVDAGGTLVGIVSEADILTDPLAGRPEHGTVGRVMTRTPITLEHTATAGDARALVADRGLRLVPVVDAGRLVGVVSRSDLV